MWTLSVFASDAFHDHAPQYPDLAVIDLAAQVMDNYAGLRQALGGAKFNQMTNEGISDYLLTATYGLRNVMWPLMDDLNTLSEQLNSHVGIYRRDLTKQLTALGIK